MSARIDRVVTSGVFSLDGQDFDVDNNAWLVGDDDEVLVIDAPHDAAPIVEAVAGRRVTAIVLTHGHNDHINAAVALRDAVQAPIWFNPADRMLWDAVHPDAAPDETLGDGATFEVAGVTLTALATPGHSPGSTCLYAPDLGTVFTGDTLFHGGPGATGRSYSDKPTILESIRTRLLALPGDTVVRTGHGDDTTIATEARSERRPRQELGSGWLRGRSDLGPTVTVSPPQRPELQAEAEYDTARQAGANPSEGSGLPTVPGTPDYVRIRIPRRLHLRYSASTVERTYLESRRRHSVRCQSISEPKGD